MRRRTRSRNVKRGKRQKDRNGARRHAASYLVGDVMLSRDAGGSAEFLKLGNEGCSSSRVEPVDP
jgi:hypothetical protein